MINVRSFARFILKRLISDAHIKKKGEEGKCKNEVMDIAERNPYRFRQVHLKLSIPGVKYPFKNSHI